MEDLTPAAQRARERWNRRFADGASAPSQQAPSEWLVDNADLLRLHAGVGRRALDVAAGSGRNALHLATLGFTVDALDISDVAVDLLRGAARKRDLAVDARVVDLESEQLRPDRYDVIVNLNYLQRSLYGALVQALAPGGLLLFETFGPAHLERLGRDVNPDFVLTPAELLRAFGGLRVRRYFEGVASRSGRERGVQSIAAERTII